jgi:hypothetical protein
MSVMIAWLSKLLSVAVFMFSSLSIWYIVGASSGVTTHEVHWPDGTLQSISTEDREGRLHGTRQEYYPDGTLQAYVETTHGSWTAMLFYWPSGNLKMRCTMTSGGDVRVSYDDVAQE